MAVCREDPGPEKVAAVSFRELVLDKRRAVSGAAGEEA